MIRHHAEVFLARRTVPDQKPDMVLVYVPLFRHDVEQSRPDVPILRIEAAGLYLNFLDGHQTDSRIGSVVAFVAKRKSVQNEVGLIRFPPPNGQTLNAGLKGDDV